jgi:hypothetical protein
VNPFLLSTHWATHRNVLSLSFLLCKKGLKCLLLMWPQSFHELTEVEYKTITGIFSLVYEAIKVDSIEVQHGIDVTRS